MDALAVSEWDALIKDQVKRAASLAELVRWYVENPEKRSDLKLAAEELGTDPRFLESVIASRAFRKALLEHIATSVFTPEVIAEGMLRVADDLVDPTTNPQTRLGILRSIGELMGVPPTQKVEHEITARKVEVKFAFEASPSDFVLPDRGGGDGREVDGKVPLPARGAGEEALDVAWQEEEAS